MKFMMTSQGRVLTPTILLGIIIWAATVLTASADLTNCAPAPPGLAGWWAGEGSAQDNLGGNNGALFGGMGFGAGKVGQAFSFDGSSGYVEMPASASLDVGAGAGLTFECWIKPAALADAQPVAEWNSGAHPGLNLWISQPPPYGGGSGSLYVNLIDTAGTSHTLTTGGGILNTNGFQHVALSYDKASGMASLYYNGSLVAAGTLGSFTPQTSVGLYLGKCVSDAPFAAFHGLMDEASLYSRALTAAEIQAIYNADGAGKCSSGTAPSITTQPAGQTVLAGATATFSVVAAGSSPLSYQWRLNGANLSGANGTALTLTNVQLAQGGSYSVQVTNLFGSATSSNAVLTVNPVLPCAPPPSGLVSWWAAEGNALDSVGTNNGVLTNGAGFAVGEVGQAFSFNGNLQRVSIPYSRTLVATNYSVEAWVKPLAQVSGSPSQNFIVGQPYGWQLVVRPGTSGIKVVFAFAASSVTFYSVVSTSELPLRQFSHMVGSWDGTTLRLYINGVLNAQAVPGARPVDLGYGFCIGGSFDEQYFNGLIDEASYYSRALSAAEIQALYNAGSAGKCHTPVPPSVQTPPQSQVVALRTNASFSVVAAGTSPLSYQWHFNGADIAGATGSVLTLTNVQFTSAGAYDVTVTNLYGATNSSAATLTVLIPPAITGQPQDQTVGVGSNATFSVAATGSGPLSYQWYFNGAALSGATSTSLVLSGVSLSQAGSYGVTVSNLVGSVISRSAALVVLGNGACTPPPAGLVSWWAAEGTAADAVGTNNGVLVNGAGFGAGEVGQAFSFNGNLQRVSIPYSRTLVATNYSVEAWVKPLAQVSGSPSQNFIVGQPYGWQLVVRPGSSGVKVVFLFATSTVSFYSVVSTSELPLGQFSHVMGTWDGTTLRLYINGVLNAQQVAGAIPVDLGYGFYIGGSFDEQYFNGLIDEASYYSRALSAAEIEGVYSAGSAGKCHTPVPPSIQAPPQSQAVPPGGTASFMVVAAGTSPLSYQWHFNGAGIAGATSSVLALTNVQLANAGTYDVTVTNLYGSANSAGATLTLLGTGACTPPPAGLVSWWTAEGTAADAVGTNNGVLVNGAGFSAGEVGQAFSFNGNLQRVSIPYSRTLVATNYSVEAWVKPLAQVSGWPSQDFIVGQPYGWQLVVRPGSSGVKVVFLFATSTVTFYSVVSTSELPLGQFSHMVGSWDGTTLRLYINGVLNAQKVPGATPVDLGYGFYIGGSFDGQYFNGLIDEASYYSRALSGAEIQTIYNAGSAGKCPVGVGPSILKQPASQAVSAGANAAFSVTTAGTPPLSYQWQFSGTNIAGATGASLTLSNVQSAQAGSYAVRVTNTFGSVTSSNAVLTVNQAPSCAPVPSGLVSWWRAEGSASDGVAGNNGTLLNDVSFASGMVGQAFSFNGSNQCVQIPHAASLVASNYSIEAWVKPLAQVSDAINQDLIFGQSFGYCQLVARTGSPGVRLAFAFGTSHTSFYEATGTSEIPIGQFSHLAGTWDGTTLRLYINGVLNAQSTPHASPVDSGCPFYIGGTYNPTADSCGYVGQFFNGLIDEASYYSRALSGAEIQSIYNAGGAGKCSSGVGPSIITQPASQAVSAGANAAFSVTTAGTPSLSYQWQFSGTNIAGATGASLTLSNVQSAQAGSYAVRVTNTFGLIMSSNALLTVILSSPCAPPPAGLVSWWRAEGSALDVVGGNNGTPTNGASFALGRVGQAFLFNGTNSYVQVADSPSLRLTNELTIEFWVKRQDLNANDTIINKGGDYTRGAVDYGVVIPSAQSGTGSTLGFTFAGSTRHATSIADLNWHHVAVVARNGDADPTFYVDGVQQPITLRQGAATVSFYPSTQPLTIGAQIDPVSGWYYYSKAMVDELSIYNRALTAAEIQAIYNADGAGKCSSGTAPSIIAQPASQAVSAGATAAFAVTAAGTPPLSYQWQFSGTNIAGATGASLTLSNVQSAQAGSYAVRVTNTFGSIMSSNALLTVISSPPCATPPAGLVSWWRAEGTARDSVAGNHGTLLNGASFASGMVGQAFSFSGSNQCVQVPHAASLLASNYSIEAWVKPLAQVSDAINQDLIFGQSFGQCQLVARTGSTGVRLAFSFGTSHTSFYEVTGTSEIPIGQFSHLAGTWDGTTLRLYINGVLNAQSTPHASPVDSGCPFYIGGFYSPTADNCGYVGQFFNGLIDEASYYSRALSGAEIQSIYNAGGAGKCALGRRVLPLRLQVSVNPDGTKQVQFVGNNSQSYRIEVSADLVRWVSLGTCTADAEGNVEFTDPNVAKQPLRFYRAVEQ